MQWLGYILFALGGAFLVVEVIGLTKDIINRKKNKKKGDKDE